MYVLNIFLANSKTKENSSLLIMSEFQSRTVILQKDTERDLKQLK